MDSTHTILQLKLHTDINKGEIYSLCLEYGRRGSPAGRMPNTYEVNCFILLLLTLFQI